RPRDIGRREWRANARGCRVSISWVRDCVWRSVVRVACRAAGIGVHGGAVSTIVPSAALAEPRIVSMLSHGSGRSRATHGDAVAGDIHAIPRGIRPRRVKRSAAYHRGVLVGRGPETAMIDRLLAQARSGLSGVLVVRGEPGVGKSALLEHAVETAKGFAVLRGVGIESEAELAFAGLHQVVRPVLDRLDRLPAP